MARIDRTVPGGAVLLGAVRPPRPRVTGLAGDGTDLFEPGSQVSPFCGGLRRHGPWVRARAILLCPWRIASLRLWLDVEARRTAFTTVTAGGVASGGCTASFRHRPRSRALHVRRRRRPVLKAAGWSTCTPCRGQRRRAARNLRLQVHQRRGGAALPEGGIRQLALGARPEQSGSYRPFKPTTCGKQRPPLCCRRPPVVTFRLPSSPITSRGVAPLCRCTWRPPVATKATRAAAAALRTCQRP